MTLKFKNIGSYYHDSSNPNYKKLTLWFCFDENNNNRENADYYVIFDEGYKSQASRIKIKKKGEEVRYIENVTYGFEFDKNHKDSTPTIKLSWTEIESKK
jgi:hypothetical protein